VTECLKARIVDSIRKRHFLGNGQGCFHCNNYTNSYFYSNVDRRFLHNGGVIFMTTDKLNPLIRCSLLSWRRTLLRGWLTVLTDGCRHRYRDRVRRVLESRVQHGAKKTEVKIRLPGRADADLTFSWQMPYMKCLMAYSPPVNCATWFTVITALSSEALWDTGEIRMSCILWHYDGSTTWTLKIIIIKTKSLKCHNSETEMIWITVCLHFLL
jgi:hypothetical protein